MLTVIDTASYVGAAGLLVHANDGAADAAMALFDALDAVAASAGKTKGAAAWCDAYNEAATTVAGQLSRLIDAFGNCVRLLDVSGHNHARAEAAAAAYGLPSYALPQRPLRSAGVSGLLDVYGGDADRPHGWELIVSHLGGYIWPGADLPRLRGLAMAWHTAADRLRALEYYPSQAAAELELLSSAELPDAVDACQRLGKATLTLADDCDTLGASCSSFVHEVQAQRDPVRHAVIEFFAAIGISEIGGHLLAAVTGGLSELVAKAVEAGVFAGYGARITGLLSTLEDALPGLAPATAAGADDAWVAAMADAEPVLADIEASTSTLASEVDAGLGGNGVSTSGQPGVTKQLLESWEQTSKSHTLRKHVGRTYDELMERLADEPDRALASTFTSADEAVDGVNQVLKAHESQIESWLSGLGGRLNLEAKIPEGIGQVVDRAGTMTQGRSVWVQLVRDAGQPSGYRLHTAYVNP